MSTSYSASRAARTSPPTTRSSTPGSATSSCATRPAAATPPRATRRRPARSASAWPPAAPGATNVVTPIQDAMMDSVPTVFITGQVRTDLLGTDGFQEADVLGITMPAVKHSFMIQHPLEIPRALHEAFYLARSGRPGPIVVDIPTDLSRADIPYEPVTDLRLPGYQPTTEGNAKQIRQAAKALAASRRPVLYAGGGVVNANASAELVELATADSFPITCTLMGLGRLPGAPRAVAGHARHARDPHRQLRDGRGRPHLRDRRALRRSRHRQAQRVRAAGEVHPHRHRPGRDLQERAGPHPDRRRREEHPGQAGAPSTARWRPTARGWTSGGSASAAGRSAIRCATRSPRRPRSSRST